MTDKYNDEIIDEGRSSRLVDICQRKAKSVEDDRQAQDTFR